MWGIYATSELKRSNNALHIMRYKSDICSVQVTKPYMLLLWHKTSNLLTIEWCYETWLRSRRVERFMTARLVLGHHYATASTKNRRRSLHVDWILIECWATVSNIQSAVNSANTKHLYNTCTMLGQPRRRWTGVVQMLYKYSVFAGMSRVKLKCNIRIFLQQVVELYLKLLQLSSPYWNGIY